LLRVAIDSDIYAGVDVCKPGGVVSNRVGMTLGTFLPRDALVHSAVLRLHVVRLSVCLSVCNVGGSGSHRLGILETNCTVN